MIETLRSTLDVILDRPPGDLIGAGMIALTLALAMTGLYALRRKKTGEPLIVLIVLMLCANVISMALVAGYLVKTWRSESGFSARTNRNTARRPAPGGLDGPVRQEQPWGHLGGSPPPPAGRGPGDPHIRQVFAVADADKDGRLTPDEAALFVKAADPNGIGSVNEHDFSAAIRGHLSHPPAPTLPHRMPDPDEPR
jgi:hypothetical protein